MTLTIDQRTGETALTSASYATVDATYRAGNDAGDGYPVDPRLPMLGEHIHESSRTDELDVYRMPSGAIVAISNDGWACDLGQPDDADR